MSRDLPTAREPAAAPDSSSWGPAGATGRRAPAPSLAEDSQLAVEVRDLVERGQKDDARERFDGLVALHQRRASRIAFQYLRDSAETDDAVQDAFVKVFTHIGSYRETWPFEVWFTRILINVCLDRRKARARRDRWLVEAERPGAYEARVAVDRTPDPERALLARERRSKLAAAVDRLDGRQRTVFMLCHYGDCTPRDISVVTGLKESTVRVHLFRAVRRLRALLGGEL
jgi:RNA polymerase sigma-70 factor, ECF subfamily